LRAVPHEDQLRDRVELVLRQPGRRTPHRLENRLAADLRRASDQPDLGRALDRPHPVQDGRQVFLFERRHPALQQLAEVALPADAAVPGIRRRIRGPAPGAVRTLARAFRRRKRHVNHLRAGARLKIGQQLIRRFHLVHAGDRLRLCRVVRREQVAFDGGAAGVLFREIQNSPLRRAIQQQQRLRRDDPGEVEELVRLPEHRRGVDARQSLHQRERVRADRLVHLRAAGAELLNREVGGERAPRLSRSAIVSGDNGRQQSGDEKGFPHGRPPLKTLGASGIAAPSWRGSDPA
jgi:hypothetical protein